MDEDTFTQASDVRWVSKTSQVIFDGVKYNWFTTNAVGTVIHGHCDTQLAATEECISARYTS